MPEPIRCSPHALAPHKRTRAGWNQALLGACQNGNHHLLLDLTAPDRLETGLLACLIPVEQELLRRGGSLRIDPGDRDQRIALWLGGMGRLIGGSGIVPGDLSCNVIYGDDEVRIAIHRSAMANPKLQDPTAHQWLARVATARVVIDLGDITHVNSVMVAWLLQLCQSGRPAETAVVNVSRQAAIQLNQLRLNHMLQVHTAE